jgi:cytochrome d ubiquinol oxidase subunit II
MFSGFYLPLLLILLGLIVRGLAFEYRHQRPQAAWHAWWDRALFVGSVLPAILWGVAFANLVRGVPIDADKDFTGNLLTLLNPFALLGGLVTLLLFLTHGAMFLGLKTDGDIRHRSRRLSVRFGVATAAVAVLFLVWAQVIAGDPGSAVLFVLAALALVAGVGMAARGREGWAFAGTFATIALAVAGLFAALFPDVMPSTTSDAFSLTTANASATDYTLTLMTWVALIFVPVVLAYQSWTYWTFRRRISVHHIPEHAEHAAT